MAVMAPTDAHLDALARLTRELTSPCFLSTLETTLREFTAFDSIVVVIYAPHQHPRLLHPQDPAEQSATLRFYLAHAYVLDPIFNAIEQGQRQGVFRLAQLAPDHFEQTEYYQTCYRDFGLVEETNLFISLPEQATCAISLGRNQASGRIAQKELNLLKRYFVIIEALVQQFWEIQKEGLQSAVLAPQASRSPLTHAVETFAAEALTEREREIIGLLLRGYSSKSIAQTLGISAETVKVHRKNIHARLGTSSQADIFNLFLEHIEAVATGVEASGI